MIFEIQYVESFVFCVRFVSNLKVSIINKNVIDNIMQFKFIHRLNCIFKNIIYIYMHFSDQTYFYNAETIIISVNPSWWLSNSVIFGLLI